MVDHFSLGVSADLSADDIKGVDAQNSAAVITSEGSVSLSARVGADIPFASLFSVYPLASLAVGHSSYDETSSTGENKYGTDVVAVGLYVPLLVHPAPHVFLGFGPSVYHELTDAYRNPDAPLAPSVENRETTFGAGFIVGGTIDVWRAE